MWVEKHGPSWRVRDRQAGRKVTLAEGYGTKTAAKAAMVQLEADELRGDALVPRGGRTTVRELVELWWPDYERRLAPTAKKSEGGRLRKHILPLLGDVPLEDVTSAVVHQWVRDLEHGRGPVGEPWRPGARVSRRMPLAPKTVANCHGLLFVLMAFAVAERLVRANPCVGTSLPERVHQEMRCLSDVEIERLLAALPAQWRPLVLLLVTTGLRWGEAIGLKVGRVHLRARIPALRVEEQLQLVAGRMVFCPPKSARSRRTVAFERSLARTLRALIDGRDDDCLVFTTSTGSAIRPHSFRRIWASATKRAGLEGLRPHDLRHTHAAILLSAGVPMEKISRRLGHASLAVTDLIYGHLRAEADDAILAAVEATISSIGLSTLEDEVADELVDELALVA